MLTNDLLNRHMFKFEVTISYNMTKMKNMLFYANEQYANELIIA